MTKALQEVRKIVHDRMLAAIAAADDEEDADGRTTAHGVLVEEAAWLDALLVKIDLAMPDVERFYLFARYANRDIAAQVEGASTAKRETGKYPFED